LGGLRNPQGDSLDLPPQQRLHHNRKVHLGLQQADSLDLQTQLQLLNLVASLDLQLQHLKLNLSRLVDYSDLRQLLLNLSKPAVSLALQLQLINHNRAEDSLEA